jgi:hypothetical protein
MKLYKQVDASKELPLGDWIGCSVLQSEFGPIYRTSCREDLENELKEGVAETWFKPTTISEIIKERITEEILEKTIMSCSEKLENVVEFSADFNFDEITGHCINITKAAKAIMDKLTNE